MNARGAPRAGKPCGQALIESVLLIPVMVLLVSGIFLFARALLAKQQLVMAARYGTDMIAYTAMDETAIQNELTDYLCGRQSRGRRLDPGKLRFSIKKELFPGIAAVHSLDKAKQLRDMLLKPAEHTSFVEIRYEIAVPGIFTAWDRFVPGKLPGKLTVSARSEILAGTGA